MLAWFFNLTLQGPKKGAGTGFSTGDNLTREHSGTGLGLSIVRELCRLLSYLKSPTVVARTLKLMATFEEPAIPEWAELASRNDGYGGTVKKMLLNLPSIQKLHYAYCLRTVPGPWWQDYRAQSVVLLLLTLWLVLAFW